MNRSGFTLIELLLVIGLLAMLAWFIVPNFRGPLERTYFQVCVCNMIMIYIVSILKKGVPSRRALYRDRVLGKILPKIHGLQPIWCKMPG